MAQPLTIALPPDHILTGAYKVRLTAISATTGAVVSGVNIQNVTMQVEDMGEVPLDSGAFKAVYAPVLLKTGV